MHNEFDFVIVGAGAAGEAAAYLALERGARVAIVDRDLFGGACAHIACMPSKTLLHAAAVHRLGGAYDWSRASDRRDWMINRVGLPYPDDSGHHGRLEAAGAATFRGSGRISGIGRVVVDQAEGEPSVELRASSIIVAVGSSSRIPDLAGLAEIPYWTNSEATTTRELPRSLLALGGGPTSVELAQVYARYGVPTTIVESNARLLARDHPRNSAAVTESLSRDGVTVRAGVRALAARAGAGPEGAHLVDLSDGTTVAGHVILLAIGRAFPLEGLGLEHYDLDPTVRGGVSTDGRLRVADGLFVIGDPAGPELHTHTAHYQGEMAVRIALGEDVRPDYRAIPRAVYTDPETGFVGLSLEEALAHGIDAVEFVADIATTAKGFVTESGGHVTIVVDRTARVLAGAALAGPGASEAVHEAVLAVKARIPLAVLADTIHAFPTTARVLGNLFVEADRSLAAVATS